MPHLPCDQEAPVFEEDYRSLEESLPRTPLSFEWPSVSRHYMRLVLHKLKSHTDKFKLVRPKRAQRNAVIARQRR